MFEELSTQFGKDLHTKAFNKWCAQMLETHLYLEEDCIIDVCYSITKFINYNKRKLISSPYSDITFWFNKQYEEFQKFIFNLDQIEEEKLSLKNSSTDAVVLFENETILVLKPNTHLAARKYGKNTKWCVTYSLSMSKYIQYSTNGWSFYYILPKKNDDDKMVIYTQNNNSNHITNQADQYMSKEEWYDRMKTNFMLSWDEIKKIASLTGVQDFC